MKKYVFKSYKKNGTLIPFSLNSDIPLKLKNFFNLW